MIIYTSKTNMLSSTFIDLHKEKPMSHNYLEFNLSDFGAVKSDVSKNFLGLMSWAPRAKLLFSELPRKTSAKVKQTFIQRNFVN